MNTQEKPGLHIVQIHYSPKTLCTIFCLKKKKKSEPKDSGKEEKKDEYSCMNMQNGCMGAQDSLR